MKLFIYEYGTILIGVLIAIVVLGVIFSGFVQNWREFGGVDDSIKTNFLTDEEKRTSPVLTARDGKVHTGEPVNVKDYVSASDYDGRDISDQIETACERKKPGILRYALRVESPVTGKVVTGSVVILVDGPGEVGHG